MRKHGPALLLAPSVALTIALTMALPVALGLAGAAARTGDDSAAIRLRVDKHRLHGGQSFTATATATVSCDWTLAWNGRSHRLAGRSISATFTAPRVTEVTRIPVHAFCRYAPRSAPSTPPAPTSTGGQRITVTVPAHRSRTLPITVLPPGSAVSPPQTSGGGGPGTLPNTGGPGWWLLAAGLGAVLAGGYIVRRTQA